MSNDTIVTPYRKVQKPDSLRAFFVGGQEHVPIEAAFLAAFLFYRYKFMSQVKDKNIVRLPIRDESK
ncbi:hypothetical protein J43TS9_15050 [Paenibacillus cineris]|nr:hypothetical protein J43TS9_15050 [Paenibacillus cineris]